MIWCIKCGCETFWQAVTFTSDVMYEVNFDECRNEWRKDLQDRYDYDHKQDGPFKCKKCGSPLVDEQGVPLLKIEELLAWAKRMESPLEEAAQRYMEAKKQQ